MSTGFTITLKIRLLSIQLYKLYHYWITKSDWKLYLLSVICYWRHGCTYRRSLVFMVEEEVDSWGWWRFRLMLRMLWRCRRRLRRRFGKFYDEFLCFETNFWKFRTDEFFWWENKWEVNNRLAGLSRGLRRFVAR